MFNWLCARTSTCWRKVTSLEPRAQNKTCHRSCQIDGKLRVSCAYSHRLPTTSVRISYSIPDVGDAIDDCLTVAKNAPEYIFVVLRRKQVQLLARQCPELWHLGIAVGYAAVVQNVLADRLKKRAGQRDRPFRVTGSPCERFLPRGLDSVGPESPKRSCHGIVTNRTILRLQMLDQRSERGPDEIAPFLVAAAC